ncbi:MAG: flagellar hook-basal body complex protein FliE [Thermodesulfobacteriaceae bacterium]|nr:flagellar hook-basal body complex protein FliE [Thermodesulfobacteriaceae bacterium]
MKITKAMWSNLNLNQRAEKKASIDFQKMLLDKLNEIDQKEREAEEALLGLAKGEDIDPTEVAQKISAADVSMKLLLRVRNKVLEAYQEIKRTQI